MKIKEMEEAQATRFVKLTLSDKKLTRDSLNDLVPTGDAEYDARQRKRQDHTPVLVINAVQHANRYTESRKRWPNLKRMPRAVSSETRTKQQLSWLPLLVVQRCHLMEMQAHPVAKTHNPPSGSVRIVVRSGTSRPTKSQSMPNAEIAISHLIARLGLC
jgi:hypothetical protein